MLRFISRFTILILMLIFTVDSYGQKSSFSIKKIVIDPGHGGKDPGATVGKTYEKNIALDVALKAGKMIKKMYPDVEVIYTRDKDVFIPLGDRADIANKQKADLFFSIHVNICATPSTTGAETYILGQHRSQENLDVAKLENAVILLEDDYSSRYEGFDPNSSESYIMFELMQNEYLEQSRLFADRIQNHFVSHAKRKDRGVRQAGFLVLRKTAMPSVLIELGFMSNNYEKDFMEKEQGKTLLAESIAKSFSDYKTRFDEHKEVATAQPQATTPKPEKPAVKENPATQEKPQTPSSEEKKDTASENSPKPNDTPKVNDLPKTIETNKPNETTNTADTKIDSDISKLSGKWYGTQIMAIKKLYNLQEPIFKKQEPVFYLYENGFYKYFLGVTQNSDEAQKLFSEISKKFSGAFLVTFENGQKKIFK